MEIAGMRAVVQWNDGVYEGSVQLYDEQRGLYCVCYDDGDIEWMKLTHKDDKLMASARGVALVQNVNMGGSALRARHVNVRGKRRRNQFQV